MSSLRGPSASPIVRVDGAAQFFSPRAWWAILVAGGLITLALLGAYW